MLISPVTQGTAFKSNSVVRASGNSSADDALLMLKDPKTAVIFKKNEEIARKANSNDPITALGYKLYRTFRYLTNADSKVVEPKANDEKFVALA